MKNITSCLWFDNEASDAAKFYTSIFPNSKIINTTYYYIDTPSNKSIGSIMTVEFELSGLGFSALNGGQYFKINPAISFFITSSNLLEMDSMWSKLLEGGKVLMPYEKYEWAEKYGWLEDKYGVSWQISFDPNHQSELNIMPSLLFTKDLAGNAKSAIEYYVDVFSNSSIQAMVPYESEDNDRAGYLKYSQFNLNGMMFSAMDSSGPHDFLLSEATSFIIECKTQEEIDYYWEALSAIPESEQCGWVKDKFGVSWQIIPSDIGKYLNKDADPAAAKRSMEAMMKMKKISINDLENAYNSI